MKKIMCGLLLAIVAFTMTGCSKGDKLTYICTSSQDNSLYNYSVEGEYKVYMKDGVVTKVITKEVATSDDEDILNQLETYSKTMYANADKTYGGYKYSTSIKGDELTINVTVNYDKMDRDKFAKDNSSSIKKYVNDDNKYTKEGIKDLYEDLGATCKAA